MNTDHAPLLNGIKVIELASVLAGPSVGMFLAELGASVIKIENPAGGDPTRAWKSAGEDTDGPVSAYYCSANWGKEVVTANLAHPSDRDKVLELIGLADIVLLNFKAGDEIKFNLDDELLRRTNPKLIIGKITGFPDDNRPAFDIVLQAETGMMLLNGTDKNTGLKWPLPIVDILAAHQLKEGILLALYKRALHGVGSVVKVSLYEAALASMYNVATNVLMGGSNPVASGPLHPNIAPYGEIIYSQDDVPVVLAVGTDAQFAALCRVLGLDRSIYEDFSTNQVRVINRNKLQEHLCRAARGITFNVLNEALIQQKVPFGRINSLKEVLHILPERYFLKEKVQGTDTVRMRTAVFTIKS